MSTQTKTGFFIDWDGSVRTTESPGDDYATVISRKGSGANAYDGVDVLDSDGGVIHEATYYPSIEAMQADGLDVVMAVPAKPAEASIERVSDR